MSQAELCSRIIGPCNIGVKGENFTIMFEDKGGIGYAKVTHEQAERFLKLPEDFWRPGQRNKTPNAVEDALAADPVAAEEAAKIATGRKNDMNLAQMVELIKLCETVEEVDAMVKDDDRAGVMTAAGKRKAHIMEQETNNGQRIQNGRGRRLVF